MRSILISIACSGVLALPLLAQRPVPIVVRPMHADSDTATYVEHKMSGPRVGMVWVSGARATEKLAELHLHPVMSVFGWHFEQVTKARSGGPQLVSQQVFAIAGLEQGMVIPSGSFMFGMRLHGGFEFGVGPNISPFGVGMTYALGQSITLPGDVTIPVNLALISGQGSQRLSVLVGYALRRH